MGLILESSRYGTESRRLFRERVLGQSLPGPLDLMSLILELPRYGAASQRLFERVLSSLCLMPEFNGFNSFSS